jgi:hypothetical protein
MCKEMPVIPVDRLVDKKTIIGKNGGPRRRRGTWGRCPHPPPKNKTKKTDCSEQGVHWMIGEKLRMGLWISE